MDRAYSVLEIRSIDDDKRIIEGIASTPSPDHLGDIVEPKGATYSLPIPFLWQHNAKEPIGHVTKVKVEAEGITVRVQLAKVDEPGELKSLLDKSWGMIKAGLVRGLSVGFKPIEATDIKGTFSQRFLKWQWLELSAVTIPANMEATITTVKQFDQRAVDADQELAATGTAPLRSTDLPKPGATGRAVKALPINHKPGHMETKESIRQFEATRQAKAARLSELMKKANDAGETLDQAAAEEYENIKGELIEIDKHLVRLHDLAEVQKATQLATATPVNGQSTTHATTSRGQVIPIKVKSRAEPGMGFVRKAIAIMATNGNKFEAAEYAKARWGDQADEIVAEIKAAVAAGTTTDASWAAPLVPTTPLAGEFLELLRPSTLLGKLEGRLRQVPFNVSVPAVTSGGSVAWVGQGSAKPLTALALSTVTVGFAKAAGIVVLSDELIKLSTPSAEGVVRSTMSDTMRVFMDVQFIDPAVAAVANVNPASITNGVAGTAASGVTEAAARTDLRALVKTFATNNIGMGGVVLAMSESDAFTLGTMVNSVGGQAFPGLTMEGGNILGVPVVTSNSIVAQIVAIHAPSILYADDGQTQIDVSKEASVQMDSAPANPTDATTVMVSLWQRNLVGLRFERYMNWIKARSTAVQRIHTVAYA
jgi:HK97 family phage major capsid protein/HK97 family phage prohead protease